jgi:glycine/D-amino acid oxidase-like deaminating enzyme
MALDGDSGRGRAVLVRAEAVSHRFGDFPRTQRRVARDTRWSIRHASRPQRARRIFGHFAARFPDLQGVRVSHCWTGRFAVSSDLIPHIGVKDGLYYVLGCRGTGVPMSTYLGHKLALKILGQDAGSTVFDRRLPPDERMEAGARAAPAGGARLRSARSAVPQSEIDALNSFTAATPNKPPW